MKLALMQPYFFPYLGYFDLIQRTDRWVVLDTVQYIRRGWMHRNRILHPQEGWQYIHVPIVRCPRDTPIHEIQIDTRQDWQDRLLRQLAHYRRHAVNYTETIRLVGDCLCSSEVELSRLNTAITKTLCAELGIPFRFDFLSKLKVVTQPVERPDDWALQTCRALGATRYVNPPGGQQLYSAQRFEAAGIALEIQPRREFDLSRYCEPYRGVPNLSIIDALMWLPWDQLPLHTSPATTGDRLPPVHV